MSSSLLDFGEGFFSAERFAIRALGCHCCVAIGDSQQTAQQWNSFTAQAIWVSGAVVTLVVVPHAAQHHFQMRHVLHDHGTKQRMLLHELHFFFGQPARFAQDTMA